MTITSTVGALLQDNDVFKFLNLHITNIAINTLKTSDLPKHVAFIMDGNRRFAKNRGLKLAQGHEAGSYSLITIVDSCYLLGIKHCTVYAFSIENFNRSKEEVDTLFALLVEKLNLFLDNKSEYNKHAQIRIIGNRSLVPLETLQKLEEIEDLTSQNNDLILNVCFSYTSRDEIAHSIRNITDQVLKQDILVNQITEDLIQNNFYFHDDTPKVDILIRTSGHTRLSDFLIWQVNQGSESRIHFVNTYWPDFHQFQFYKILLQYSYEQKVVETITSVQEKLWFPTVKKNFDIKSLPPPPPYVSILGKTN